MLHFSRCASWPHLFRCSVEYARKKHSNVVLKSDYECIQNTDDSVTIAVIDATLGTQLMLFDNLTRMLFKLGGVPVTSEVACITLCATSGCVPREKVRFVDTTNAPRTLLSWQLGQSVTRNRQLFFLSLSVISNCCSHSHRTSRQSWKFAYPGERISFTYNYLIVSLCICLYLAMWLYYFNHTHKVSSKRRSF